MEILKSLAEWGLGFGTCYCALEQVRVTTHPTSVIITDLRNALRPGKICKNYLITPAQRGGRADVDLYNYVWHEPGDEMPEFCCQLFAGELPPRFNQQFTITVIEEKGMRTFSPFVRIAPIKQPGKWRPAHVWKSILAGQITVGQVDMYLTDDYRLDDARDFCKGQALNLVDFARRLIERPRGWWVMAKQDDGNTVELSVNHYHFEHNTLIWTA